MAVRSYRESENLPSTCDAFLKAMSLYAENSAEFNVEADKSQLVELGTLPHGTVEHLLLINSHFSEFDPKDDLKSRLISQRKEDWASDLDTPEEIFRACGLYYVNQFMQDVASRHQDSVEEEVKLTDDQIHEEKDQKTAEHQ